MSVPFPPDVQTFVDTANWKFAKTYASTWPHEYVVKSPGNARVFDRLAMHIYDQGEKGYFYNHRQRYFRSEGKVYWIMSSPGYATVINRCNEDQTYEARKAAGTLPVDEDCGSRGWLRGIWDRLVEWVRR